MSKFQVNDSGSFERAICECDRHFDLKLATAIYDEDVKNYDFSKCQRREPTQSQPKCCQHNNLYFILYNALNHCCENGAVKPLNLC